MRREVIFTTIMFSLIGWRVAFCQVGIGTTMPKTTLQVEGAPNSATTADGIQVPSLTLMQLEAKVAVYGSDQNGALVYINDVSVASTLAETVRIVATGFYYFESSSGTWKGVGSELLSSCLTYEVGDFAHGGVVFWVDETGQHGLVCAKQDQTAGARWYPGTDANTFINTLSFGDGPFSGKLNTALIIANHGLGTGNVYAARLCNELQITEGGKIYGDWYLPSKNELNLMYQNKAIIDATATANSGSGFYDNTDDFYWSSNELNDSIAWRQQFSDGIQSYNFKLVFQRVRAVRSF